MNLLLLNIYHLLMTFCHRLQRDKKSKDKEEQIEQITAESAKVGVSPKALK
jgi:hypothetical protein